MRVKVAILSCLVLMLGAFAALLAEQTLDGQTHASTRDGVYTAQQAERGRTSYNKACASCHSANLDGVGQTPPLAGPDFTAHWSGQPVDELFEKIQTTMPADHPGRISRAENADVLAYMLKVNKFPPGEGQLPSDAEGLKQIQFDDPPSKK